MSANIHFISAGAGSGKTYRLTEQLQELLSDPNSKVTPSGVIATTFTKLAAGELQERVRGALIEAGQSGVANQMEQALIGTVNSVCGEILRRFAFEAGMPPDPITTTCVGSAFCGVSLVFSVVNSSSNPVGSVAPAPTPSA